MGRDADWDVRIGTCWGGVGKESEGCEGVLSMGDGRGRNEGSLSKNIPEGLISPMREEQRVVDDGSGGIIPKKS